MSAPAWLLDAIQATKSETVLNVPSPVNIHWVQSHTQESLINRRLEANVPIVPTVPSNIKSQFDKLEIVDAQREHRHAKVLDLLEGKRFALIVEDEKTDPVIVMVGIHDVATFELAIPRYSYDGITLLELIEKRYGENYAST